MGVPKFFRYMSERYPCLSELVREDQIPEFDNLYLDMNGIIHPCSHPDDGNVHFRITEDDIFRAIFNYIDKLFFLIKPQKLFFMAVDGVAPRAKLNQQRSRRFRSAKEAEILEKNAMKSGEKLPDSARFDSNCITPGTEFMVRLQIALKYYVKSRMSSNSLWQRCRIILSGHETPGEGEHKIMEYIRYLRSKPDYDTNTRHCLYGLDADLIVLGLCTHEMHFALLREEVSFGKKSKRVSVEETRFFLLHLNLLREYLELEFSSLRAIKEKKFQIDNIIDDWILMGFLVGNDFIPHLPSFHINSNAFPIFYETYMTVWPQMSGYINENGRLNLSNLEMFLEKLAEKEREIFKQTSAQMKYFEEEKNDNNTSGRPAAFDVDVNEITNFDFDLAKLIEDSNNLYDDVEDSDVYDEEAIFEKEFKLHKRNYYIKKLNYPEMTAKVLAEQTECYIRALQWILYYYYRGVSSWGWFYPHHYAPFASDVKNFKHLTINFNMGNPFLPFQQLLAVLPAASKELLPNAYWDLMTGPNSDIIDYYPDEFQTDLNGKKQDWEAVVLIPFIDEKKLLDAMATCFEYLSPAEIKRNIHSPMLQYDYTETSQGECASVFTFKTIKNVYCKEMKIWRDEVKVGIDYLESQNSMYPHRKCHLPGFPTMKYLKYVGKLQKARIRVFEQPTRNESMVLEPDNLRFGDIKEVAEKYLDKIVYIGWPHLIKSKVCAVTNKVCKIDKNGVADVYPRFFETQIRNIEEHTFNRMGINFGNISIIVHATTFVGTECVPGSRGKMITQAIWSKTEVSYPLQGVVTNVRVEESFFEDKKIEEVFPIGTQVFMLSSPYFGCEGKVLDPLLVYSCGRMQVNITVLPEPEITEAKQLQSEVESCYYSVYDASCMCGIPSTAISRITGIVFIIHGCERNDLPENTPKSNVGLHLKFPKNGQQLAGYARKKGSVWQYSKKTLDLIESYYANFPEIFELLAGHSSNDNYFETMLYSAEKTDKKLADVTAWLRAQDHCNAEKVACGSKSVENEAIESLKKAVEYLKILPVKSVKLQVKPHLLLKQGFNIPECFKSRSKIRLFDRIVVVRHTYQVPIGSKGTVIAIHPTVDPNPVRIECVRQVEKFYEVLFDTELPDVGEYENDVELKRIARVAETSILVVYQQQDYQVSTPLEGISNKDKNLNKIHNSTECTSWRNPVPPQLPCAYPNSQQSIFVEPPIVYKKIAVQPEMKQAVSRHKSASDEKSMRPRTFITPSITGPSIKSPTTPEQNYHSAAEDKNKSITDLRTKNISDSNDSTEALRKLLGLSLNSCEQQINQPLRPNIAFHMKQPNPNDHQQQRAINFPKPPPNWTKEASNKTMPPPPPLNNVYPQFMPAIQRFNGPPVFSNMPLQLFEDRNQMPFTSAVNSQNNFKRDTTEICPSPEARVDNISSGQSAFIPLQAMKSLRKSENNATADKKNIIDKPPPPSSPQKNQNSTQSNQTQEKTSASTNPTEETSMAVPRKVRTPKIAANFNFKG